MSIFLRIVGYRMEDVDVISLPVMHWITGEIAEKFDEDVKIGFICGMILKGTFFRRQI